MNREAFEKHIDDCIVSEVGLEQALRKDAPGNYCAPWVVGKWATWQAATAAAIPPGYVVVPESEAQDAKRYQWLRDKSSVVYLKEWPDSHGWFPSDSDDIDNACDSAMLQAAKDRAMESNA